MDPASYVDLYCERTAPGFWNEPLNAISNASFLVAAGWAWVDARLRGGPSIAETVLITLAALIGIGSFLFHTYATGWAELADVIPIWSFVVCYVLAVSAAVFWFTSGDVTTDADAATVGPLNGSVQYLPALLVLAFFAALSSWKRHPARAFMAGAALTFAASLGFRTADLAICSSVPTGSHFVWRLLNGLMIGILLLAMIRHMPPPARRA